MDPVEDFLHERHPDAADLALRVRALVREADSDLGEKVHRGWGGVGFRHPDAGYVCAIFPRPDGTVRLLFEHGVRLDDRGGLLEGNGLQTRYVTLRGTPSDPPAAALADLVRDAVAERLFRR